MLSNSDVQVTIPASLRAIVANILIERACDFADHSNAYEGLTALATEVHELVATGRASVGDE